MGDATEDDLINSVDLTKHRYSERCGKAAFDLIHRGWDSESYLITLLLAELITAENALLKAGVNKWVSVDERLPDENDCPYVAATADIDHYQLCHHPHSRRVFKQGLYTHWMCCAYHQRRKGDAGD